MLDEHVRAETERALAEARQALDGRRIWNLNSTPKGGGVAELLQRLVPLSAGCGLDARWIVLDAPVDFFTLTKDLHDLLHSEADTAPDLEPERERYEQALAGAGERLGELVRAGDVVVVHDPQPAGLIPAARGAGAGVLWRCHVGTDHPAAAARAAWSFLRPYVADAQAWVFSRTAFIWDGLDEQRCFVVQPSLDPFSCKNQELDELTRRAVLSTIGLMPEQAAGEPNFLRPDGSRDRVRRGAEILQQSPVPTGAPIVAQVSRWDVLKDHLGVLRGFVRHVPRELGAHLVLAGPASGSVDDDPASREVLEELRAAWRALPDDARARVHVAILPMDDVEENAVMVNAIQREAAVIVQKSLEEGFGLTVIEAMWKGRPVLASRRGGIQDQIEDGVSGLLLDDPRDSGNFGAAVVSLLSDPDRARALGHSARLRAAGFLMPVQLAQDAEMLTRLVRELEAPRAGPAETAGQEAWT